MNLKFKIKLLGVLKKVRTLIFGSLCVLLMLYFLQICPFGSCSFGDDPEASKVRGALVRFIASGQTSIPAKNIFQSAGLDEYETACLFTDPDSEPKRAEPAVRDYLSGKGIALKDIALEDRDYTAIMVFLSKDRFKILQFRDQVIYASGKRYYMYFEAPSAGGWFQYKGCLPYSSAIFEIKKTQDSNYIVFSHQQ